MSHISQMRKLRNTEARQLSQGHRACQWSSWHPNAGRFYLELLLLRYLLLTKHTIKNRHRARCDNHENNNKQILNIALIVH